MTKREFRQPLVLFLTGIMLFSTAIIPLYNPVESINDSEHNGHDSVGSQSGDILLNPAQKAALERAAGRSSVTNWVRDAGPDTGASNDPYNINSVHFESMVMDHTGTNIIVGGTLRGDVKFGSISPATQSGPRAFVGSLTKFGGWNWITMTGVGQGSTGGAVLGDIAVASNGTIWVTGTFWIDIEWDTDFDISNGGSIDGFVATMSPSGSWYWGTQVGGTSHYDSMHGVVVDSNGDGYVVGSFEDHTYFGNSSYNILKGVDGFITKVNGSSGEYDWVEIVGGNQGDNITAITKDSSGRIFVTGYYQGDIEFDSITLENTGYPSVFVAEIDSTGVWQWANEAKTVNGGIIPYDIEVDSNSIYIGGDAVGMMDMDGVYWWVNGTVQNAFVAKLNLTGSWDWWINSTGHTQHLQELTINPLGGVVAVGWFDMEHEAIAYANFGSTNLSDAPFAAFFAGISPSGQWLWAESAGGPNFDEGRAALFVDVGNLLMAGRYCVNHDAAGCSASIGPSNYSTFSYYHGNGFVWSVNTDSDLDNISDLNDNCPLNFNPVQDDFDSDQLGDACDSDMDGDGRDDIDDDCIGPSVNWDSTDWSIDSDGDGCRDSDEDLDDDSDGVLDLDDDCSSVSTHKNWTANDANDYDRDGCHDIIEDDDDDGDGVSDTVDDCAYAPSDRNWTSSSTTDFDSDGCRDEGDEDLDRDNDGILDTDDTCMTGQLDWVSNNTNDYDADGCNDSSEDTDDDGDGINDVDDDCSSMASNWDSSGAQDLDKDGCRDVDEDDDDDGDGIDDSVDACSRGSVGWISSGITDNDGDGCRDSGEDLDDDDDLIVDLDDGCQKGVTGWISTPEIDGDRDGCRDADEDWDDDGDGLWEFDTQGNVIDQCPGTPLSEIQFIDVVGCSPSQADDDGDGVQNQYDECPEEVPPSGLDRDENGCTDDIDHDGVKDDVDAFPNDSTQTSDSDGDGNGDNLSGSNPDACPNTPSQWIENIDSFGCASEEHDDDEDGLINGVDDCDNTPDEEIDDIDSEGCGISERDTDGDGVMDSDDQCPDTLLDAKVEESGCSDAQLSYNSGSGKSSLNLVTIGIVTTLIFIVVGGGAAFFIMNRDTDSEIEIDGRPAASDVLATLVADESNNNLDVQSDTTSGDGSGITVDGDGTEWWEDEAGVWWYRSVSMDDWAIFEQ
ncbi:MAG: hypothetical protein HOE69_06240 [Euryarchaeota archaeon]|jgi:hypothetical protein|nr:hypothetical protein [Euryarchaeota archaeon]